MAHALMLLAPLGAKPAPIPAPAPPEFGLEMLRDTLLFQGQFGVYCYWFAIIGFCLANAMACLKVSKNIWHGLALQMMTAYGGSTVCALLCAKPVAFFINESLAPVALTTFFVLYSAPPVVKLLNTTLGAVAISVAYETMRCHVLMNCARQAVATMPAFLSGTYPVPVAAPIVCGVIGGCGGGFLPASKGLQPLEAGINWRIASAILASGWLQATLIDPNTKPMFVSLVPALALESWCRFGAIVFFAGFGTFSVLTNVTPFGPNPLVLPPAAAKKKSD